MSSTPADREHSGRRTAATAIWSNAMKHEHQRVIVGFGAIVLGLAITVTVLAFNMLGDGLRDILDPRLRGGLGRYGSSKAAKKMRARS